jgi:hypothetical protein
VAVSAVDSIVTGVMLVAEGNGLSVGNGDIGNKGPGIDFVGQPDSSRQEQKQSRNTDFGNAVRTSMKELRHPKNSQFRSLSKLKWKLSM